MLIAWLVGTQAVTPPSNFDWNAASVAGTAAGTLALALVTGVLAVLTNEDVQLTRGIEAARHRPTLILRTRDILGTQVQQEGDPPVWVRRGQLVLEFENVGLGPAIDVELKAYYHASQTPPVDVGSAEIPAVTPGRTNTETAKLDWVVRGEPPAAPGHPPQQPPTPNPRAFVLSVHCLDSTLTPVGDALVSPGYEAG